MRMQGKLGGTVDGFMLPHPFTPLLSTQVEQQMSELEEALEATKRSEAAEREAKERNAEQNAVLEEKQAEVRWPHACVHMTRCSVDIRACATRLRLSQVYLTRMHPTPALCLHS